MPAHDSPQPQVYFVQAEHGGPVKIGFTTNLKRRFTHLQLGSPYRLVVRRALDADRSQELRLHRLFAEHRLHGEWFAPAPEVCAVGDALAEDPVPDGRKPRESRPPRATKAPARTDDGETYAQRYKRIMAEHEEEWLAKRYPKDDQCSNATPLYQARAR